MDTVAVLPIKTFARAKHRLSEAVEPPGRRELAEAMVGDVLDALGAVDGLDGVIAVTAEPRAADAARDAGARIVHDGREAGQSAAAALGVAAAREQGARRVLLVPGDCPALDPAEVVSLLARDCAVVIVPDRHGAGTNALLLSPPDAIEPSFGPGLVRPPRRPRPRGRRRHPGGGAPVARARRRHPGRPRGAALGAGHAARRRAPHARAARDPAARARVITLEALPGLPEVRPGDDLAALLAAAGELRASDVLVVAHKVVSKAEGRVVRLADVEPGERARELAAEHGKDPRQVEVILSETTELVRADAGRLICRTRHGFVCANAGVDASNAGAPDTLVLLPADPDGSARALRARLGCPVVITDSFGRAWRHGQCEVAIGCAGLAPAEDWRGRPDADGREMRASVMAIADEVAAAADLVRGKVSREPAVRARGLERHVLDEDGPGAAALVRDWSSDLFR